MSIINLLNQPFPCRIKRTYKDWITAIGFGLFISIFLFIFKPFGLNSLQGKSMMIIILGYGGVTSSILAINLLLTGWLKDIFNEKKWVVWKEIVWILWIFFTIGLGNFFYSNYVFYYPHNNLYGILMFQIYTLGVGFLPIIILVLIQQNFLLKKHRQGADNLNLKIKDHRHTSSEKITLFAENNKDFIQLEIEKILFIQAYGNYVKIFYYNHDNKINEEMLRTSLVRIQDQIISIPGFFKCHRAFIVNTERIKNISGNAQGYQLQLENLNEKIPVSRSFIKAFNNFIQQ